MLINIKSIDDNHVAQIKALRGVTGFGLKETKDITDKLRAGEGPIEVALIPEFAMQPLSAMSEFRTYFTSLEPKRAPEFNFRNEVRKLAIKAIKADDLSAAKDLINLFA